MKVTVVVPTYNEAENIEEFISSVFEKMSGYETTVLVVDDKSPDGTAEIVESLKEEYENLELLKRKGKQGLGSAYRDGFKRAEADVYVQMDADFSHPIDELPVIVEKTKEYDFVVGSRHVGNGERNDGLVRQLLANTGSFLYKTVLGSPVSDVTSGFRAFKDRCKPVMVRDELPPGYSYQPFSLMSIHWNGFSIKEHPIDFMPRKAGEPKFGFQDLFENVVTLFKLVYRRLSGNKLIVSGLERDEG